jgi:hypothetical protein
MIHVCHFALNYGRTSQSLLFQKSAKLIPVTLQLGPDPFIAGIWLTRRFSPVIDKPVSLYLN